MCAKPTLFCFYWDLSLLLFALRFDPESFHHNETSFFKISFWCNGYWSNSLQHLFFMALGSSLLKAPTTCGVVLHMLPKCLLLLHSFWLALFCISWLTTCTSLPFDLLMTSTSIISNWLKNFYTNIVLSLSMSALTLRIQQNLNPESFSGDASEICD